MAQNLDKPKAILFDLVGTVLVEERVNAAVAMARLLDPAENPNSVTSQEVQQLAILIYSDLKVRKDSSLLEVPWQLYARQLFERLGIRLRTCLVEAELEFWQASQVMIPTPGITPALERVSTYNIPMGVVSNSPFTAATLEWELRRHDLSKWFSFLVSSADYGFRKPHEFLFLTASSKLGIAPCNIWFVGDALEIDIAGASNAGMRAVWFNPDALPCTKVQPHAEFQNWDQFLELLEESFESF